jgi:Flp pilus assembly protein TadD
VSELLVRIPADADANLQFQAGLILAKAGMFEPAARRFQFARTALSDPYQASFNLVLVLIKGGSYDAAIRTAVEVIAAGYRKAELYNLLAQAYEKAGKINEAYESLRAATELEPEDETNYMDLVMLALERDNPDLALRIAAAGVQRVPKSHRLRLTHGVVLAMRGRFDEAAREFQLSSELSPGSALPVVAMGFALVQAEKFPDAVELFRRQSIKRSGDPLVFWFLGEALDRSGVRPGTPEEKEAVGALERAVKLDPGLSQPRAILGKMLLRRNEIDRAVEQLEKAVELDPEDPAAVYQLALALQRKGEHVRARELFSRIEKTKLKEGEIRRKTLLRILRQRQQ